MLNLNDVNNNEENDTSQVSSDQDQTSDDSNFNASEGADEAEADDSNSQGDDDSGNPSAKFQQRFDTVYGEKKEAERRAEKAEQELEELRAGKTNKDDDTPPQTWEEAETRLLAKIKSAENIKAQKETEMENKIEKEIQSIIKIDSDVKADDVWKYMEKKNISNPYQAYTQMKHEESSDNSENKDTSSKIGSNSQSSQGGKEKTSYSQIHNTPLDDI